MRDEQRLPEKGTKRRARTRKVRGAYIPAPPLFELPAMRRSATGDPCLSVEMTMRLQLRRGSFLSAAPNRLHLRTP